MREKEINRIDQYIDVQNLILQRFERSNDYNLSVNYLIETCFRTYDLLISINILLKSDLELTELEHPLGILLRSGLHDFIHLQYMLNKSIESNEFIKESFHSEVREYMNGHFNRIDKNFELSDNLKSIYRFKDYGTKASFKVLGILKEGKDFAKSKKLNFLEQAIDFWEWYSKYEHHGVFTYLMYNQVEDNKKRIFLSINFLLICGVYSLYALLEFGRNEFTLEELNKLEEISLATTLD
jgi:hypothetical protein